ncbi:acyl-CoA dehydrogenase [Mucilaginibacter dorajii]|uniref:Acyl-CoA dehydrogenase family protein n=1 Tax=Mucilaginibacter dorajii TaxID=692994 RepID=A0ABP7PVU9_9SPHI|nr:acyl-CoA dehydrogenase [Mucilaginibacter dorajii]MCS3734898.1 alkylation response protein AidB-like acyl-CoA dehydrogenase [Mucilaginibacter dorajii]
MSNTHPSYLLKPDWVKTIRDTAAGAEQMGALHPDQLALIYEQGWFKFLVPKAYSGLQLALPDMVRLEESLAWANGGLGWVVTLCSGAGWFGGFLSPQIAAELLNNPRLCLAGSGASTGTATITNDGYIINGTWKYASGAHHATHITANCIIKNGNEPVLNANGSELILPFIFDKKDVQVFPAWKYMGMAATGSDAYEVNNLFVKTDRCFKIDPEFTVIDEPLYRYPFLQLAEATLAANISGMAVHFLDLCKSIFEEKQAGKRWGTIQHEITTNLLNGLSNQLNQARQEFYLAVDASWQSCLTQPASHLQEVSQTSRKLAKTARECVDQLYPYCGLQAASPDTEINQVWRDLHTASQHALLTFSAA